MPKKQRIPKDITLGDISAYAASIGCFVEVKLTPKETTNNGHPDAHLCDCIKPDIRNNGQVLVCKNCGRAPRREETLEQEIERLR